MNFRTIRRRQAMRSSLWPIPLVCVVIAFAMAELAYFLDREIAQEGTGWYLFVGDTESARVVVSTIATSMLTFTGLVFTVTMLVLQLASNQLSPRVIRTFLRDRYTQLVLGVFIATFLYALLVLRRITSEPAGEPFVPALSVWLALLFVMLSVGLFVYYIHHMTQAMRPSFVMHGIAAEARDAIDHDYPPGAVGTTGPVPDGQRTSTVVLSPGPSGVLTGVDEERIIRVALRTDCVIELRACVGDFVREAGPLFTIHGSWDGSGERDLRGAVSFSPTRTMIQDVAFGFRELVDIAARALSPGINDPTTAVQAIDHLHGLLALLAPKPFPPSRRAVGGELVAIFLRMDWPDYVALACDEIRRSGQEQIQVHRRLRAMLLDLREIAPVDRRAALEEQLGLLDESAQKEFHRPELARATTPSAQGQGPGEER